MNGAFVKGMYDMAVREFPGVSVHLIDAPAKTPLPYVVVEIPTATFELLASGLGSNLFFGITYYCDRKRDAIYEAHDAMWDFARRCVDIRALRAEYNAALKSFTDGDGPEPNPASYNLVNINERWVVPSEQEMDVRTTDEVYGLRLGLRSARANG